MRRPRSTVALLVLLFLTFSLALPAEDLPETTYDESEGLFYEASPQISNLTPQAAISTSRIRVPTELAILSIRTSLTDRSIQAGRFAKARVALALRCILLC